MTKFYCAQIESKGLSLGKEVNTFATLIKLQNLEYEENQD